MKLKDKIAIVTGGSNGFGAAIVARLARDGACVINFDIEISEGGAAAKAVRLDVQDESAWQFAVGEVIRQYERIDILVSNAGVNAHAPLHEMQLAEWNRVVGINQTGVMLGIKTVLPSMIRHGAGAIVNVSSTLSCVAVPGAAAYHASKGAVTQITRNTAVSYASAGIRVNEVLPGISDTRMVRGQPADFTAAGLLRTPMGRLGRPEEIACAVAFLASDDASFITGASLPVDGGYLAQ